MSTSLGEGGLVNLVKPRQLEQHCVSLFFDVYGTDIGFLTSTPRPLTFDIGVAPFKYLRSFVAVPDKSTVEIALVLTWHDKSEDVPAQATQAEWTGLAHSPPHVSLNKRACSFL